VIRDFWEYCGDTAHTFETEFAERPALRPDRRKVLECRFFRPEVVSGLATPPYLRRYLAQATARHAPR
jgi:hypothetical protein